jgi:hypothetical protein
MWAALRDQRLWLALVVFLLLQTLASQPALYYPIDIGKADGYRADLPLVRGFFPPEREGATVFRWSSAQIALRLPGVGQRPLRLSLALLALNDEVAQRGPQYLEVWANGTLLTTLPVRRSGSDYTLLVPPPYNGSGEQVIELRSTTFIPSGDERSIGVPINTLVVEADAGPHWPAWRPTLEAMLAMLLLWLALRRAGFAGRTTLAGLLVVAALWSLASFADPLRTAFGVDAALIALALGYLLVVLFVHGTPKLFTRFTVAYDRRALRWLVLLALVVFVTRFGGKLYPDAMPGDIGFHDNRLGDTIRGMVLLLSRNRGVDFPYPPAFYTLLAPFTLFDLDRQVLLRLAGAMLDAVSPMLIYVIAVRALALRNVGRSLRWAVVAAAIYSLSAAGFMINWWNFSTHTFTQFAHLLLITAIILSFEHQLASPTPYIPDQRWLASALLLQSLVYVGHFGFWLNTSLLGGIALLVLLVAGWRKQVPWGIVRPWMLAFGSIQFIVVLLFYTGYTGLFAEQLQATSRGGLTGLAGREAATFDVLWETLWDAGFRVHFGFAAVPLALVGVAWLGLRWPRLTVAQRTIVVLMAGTLLIAVLFGSLPFISGSNLSTRWLMFSAWTIAVGSAIIARYIWQRGRAGRWFLLAAGGYMLWVTALQWVEALAFRIRPPEPF